MKAQTKAILTSLVVIALALSAVSATTYSWFSDYEESEVNITTGYVDSTIAIESVKKVKEAGLDYVPAPNDSGITGAGSGYGVITNDNGSVYVNNMAAGDYFEIVFKSSFSYNIDAAFKFVIDSRINGLVYEIECTDDTSDFKTSSWNYLYAKDGVTHTKPVKYTITFGLPTGSNGPMNTASEINVTAEIIQANAIQEVKDETAFLAALKVGAEAVLSNDLVLTEQLVIPDGAVIDLNEKKITVDDSQESRANYKYGVVVSGDATIRNGTIIAGTDVAQAIRVTDNGSLVLDNVVIDSDATASAIVLNDPERVGNSMSLVMNGGSIVSSGFAITTNGYTGNIYDVTISGTTIESAGVALYFPGEGDYNLSDIDVVAGEVGLEYSGSGVLNISDSSFISKATELKVDNDGNGPNVDSGAGISISPYENKTAVVNLENVVSEGVVGLYQQYRSAGSTIVTNIDGGDYNGSQYSICCYDGTINLLRELEVEQSVLLDGGIFDGNGNTISSEGILASNGKNTEACIITASGTLQNIVIDNDGCSWGGTNVTLTGNLDVINVTSGNGASYAYNIANGGGHNLSVSTSTFYGWGTIGSGFASAVFKECTFAKGEGLYDALAGFYSDVTYEGCTFELNANGDGVNFYVDERSSSSNPVGTLKNCKLDNGTLITAENLASSLVVEGSEVKVSNS